MNLSIPDAAAELAVSETRLRRTLLETAVPTLIEFRRTRTGVRKTTVLGPDAIDRLRAHFAEPVPVTVASQESAAAGIPSAFAAHDRLQAAVASPEAAPGPGMHAAFSPRLVGEPECDSVGYVAAPAASLPAEPAQADTAPGLPSLATCAGQTVPMAQFNALLFQHNVLREELSRVSEYLDGCDRLLGEMVRTIATLEERTRQLEPVHAAPRRTANPLTGALRTVSAGVQNAFFSRSPRPMLKPAEVYYSNVLAGS